MRILCFILFATMVIFSIGYELVLILGYSNKKGAEEFKNELCGKNKFLEKTIKTLDSLGGLRLIVGYLGAIGLLLTNLYKE